jgi:hypothetical protein
MAPLQKWSRTSAGGVDWIKVAGLAFSGAGVAIAIIGAMLKMGGVVSDVGHMKEDLAATRTQVDKLYDHVAWGQRGPEPKPQPPLPDK